MNLELELTQEFNQVLKQEEDFWKLKSRVNWLNEGDSNTRFFHTTTLNRRRRNQIIALENNNGTWVYDLPSLIELTFDFFNTMSCILLEEVSYPKSVINTIDITTIIPIDLGRSPISEEIKRAVFSV